MRSLEIKFIFSFLVIACFMNCSQPSVLGHWKPQRITVNSKEGGRIIMDLSDPEKLTKELFQAAWDKYEEDENDSISLMNNIRNSISNYQNTGLELDGNNKFVMENYNLLVLVAIPGWHISDTIAGDWILRHDTLTLSVDAEIIKLEWKFKIMNLTLDALTIKEVNDLNSNKGREILFERQ